MWDAGQTTGAQYLGVVLECHLAEGRNIFRTRKKRLSGEIKVRRKNLVHAEACVATRHLVSGIFGVHVWQGDRKHPRVGRLISRRAGGRAADPHHGTSQRRSIL